MRNLLLLLCISFTATAIQAQRPSSPAHAPHDREAMKVKMDLLHTAYFSEGLELTSEEAKAFWPVWESGKDAMHAVQDSVKFIHDAVKENSLKPLEFDQLMQMFMELSIHKAELMNQEMLKVAEIIGSQRAMKIPSLEKEFRLRMVKMRERQMPAEDKKAFGKTGRTNR